VFSEELQARRVTEKLAPGLKYQRKEEKESKEGFCHRF
jgi:hypothetical protein